MQGCTPVTELLTDASPAPAAVQTVHPTHHRPEAAENCNRSATSLPHQHAISMIHALDDDGELHELLAKDLAAIGREVGFVRADADPGTRP